MVQEVYQFFLAGLQYCEHNYTIKNTLLNLKNIFVIKSFAAMKILTI